MNRSNKLIAFLWHQGETDAIANIPEDVYYKNLSNLLHTYRSTFNANNAPFIVGDFVKQWKDKGQFCWKPIIAATKRLVNDNENTAFVETDGLDSNDVIFHDGDDIHFCRKSLYNLGERYFKAYEIACKNKQ